MQKAVVLLRLIDLIDTDFLSHLWPIIRPFEPRFSWSTTTQASLDVLNQVQAGPYQQQRCEKEEDANEY